MFLLMLLAFFFNFISAFHYTEARFTDGTELFSATTIAEFKSVRPKPHVTTENLLV